ncbi:hypothetical protein VCHA53O466_50276 [Vibrio chagasii]|nr:hypothetical protein VCHA53O466_50276 [Vibrio chagasii]
MKNKILASLALVVAVSGCSKQVIIDPTNENMGQKRHDFAHPSYCYGIDSVMLTNQEMTAKITTYRNCIDSNGMMISNFEESDHDSIHFGMDKILLTPVGINEDGVTVTSVVPHSGFVYIPMTDSFHKYANFELVEVIDEPRYEQRFDNLIEQLF